MTAKRPKDKALLSKQEIVARRKALKEKKSGTSGSGRRAIAGVFILAFSVLSFLSIATFDAKDRVGPGFRNAIGPVGHAIGEAFRGLFGVIALVIPVVGFYAAGVLFVGERERKRWPQLVAFGLFLLSGAILAQLLFKEDPSWAHAPGGLIGRELGGVMTALFSTVGTVVLVTAIAVTAAIVGTEFAFLRFCGWVAAKSVVLLEAAKAWGLAFWSSQQQRLEARKLEAEKAKAEEESFLAELEEEEAELAELEAAASEAEAAAEEADRLQKNQEEARARAIAEKEKLRIERERLAVEREAARLAKEALKSARLKEKEQRAQSVASIAPLLVDEAKTSIPQPSDAIAEPPPGEPAWVMSFFQPQPPPPPPVSIPPAAQVPSQPPMATAQSKRVPTIVEPPSILQQPPPPPPLSIPPVDAAALAQSVPSMASLPPVPVAEAAASLAPAATGAIAVGSQVSALAAALPHALARMPLIVEPKAPPKPTKVEKRKEFEFSDGRTAFDLPPLDMLDMKRNEKKALDKEAFLQTAEKLTAKLRDFGIEGEVVEIRPGPVVTMYEFKPAPGVKISRIASLSDDLAMAMEAMRVRIVAPIPGKGVVGIEVPNKEREMVFLKEIGEQDTFQKSVSKLTMCLGKDIEGMPYILDLVKAPHLLIAGTTGSGKSVSVNAMIMSILLKSTPEEVRFIMVDPKMLELSIYEGIPHLLLPVVTDPRKAAVALQWAVDEMTRRYKLLAEAGVRNITGYNTLVDAEQKKKAAAKSTVDAKPVSIKPEKKPEPVVDAKAAEAPPVEAKPVEAAPVVAPPAEAPKKKKRKLLIVDVADQPEGAVAEAAPASTEATAAPAPQLDIGVAAPAAPAEEIREAVAADAVAAPVDETKQAEIRVEEPTEEAPSEQEAAALAEAASAENPTEAAPVEERQKLPYIVVIIDELADLMMVASKEVETSIARLAQMARAAGIHLMVATQRPSTDVVTGVIKANFPSRISFMLRSKPDSMTIIGTVGAEALLGMGDMLIMPPTSAHLQRVHGCFVSENEIKKVVDHLKAQGKPVYDESILKPREDEAEGGEDGEDELSDELYDQAIAIVSEMKNVSISMLQRKMRIGYNRAARMIERMERDGVVGPADGAKPREVLVRGIGQMPGAGAMM